LIQIVFVVVGAQYNRGPMLWYTFYLLEGNILNKSEPLIFFNFKLISYPIKRKGIVKSLC